MKITGLDQLTKQLQQVEKFTKEIDGSFGDVSFDPFDAESIEHAIVNMENLIDQKADGYSSNPMITALVANMKDSYRQQIIDRATEVRMEEDKGSQDGE
ncbi:MAG: hypothetical protein E7I55_05830 [Acinetobacter ursingii]|nr:hypothetical protein [Acinetobacter ursingii]